MMRIAMTAAAIMAYVAAVWSQAYYEASGQTAIFTLAAGAKAGPTAARGQTPCGVAASGISITIARGGILITLPASQRGNTAITLYNVAGRQIYRQWGYSGKTLRLETRVFKPGIYAVRVCVDGRVYTRRFAITGRGE